MPLLLLASDSPSTPPLLPALSPRQRPATPCYVASSPAPIPPPVTSVLFLSSSSPASLSSPTRRLLPPEAQLPLHLGGFDYHRICEYHCLSFVHPLFIFVLYWFISGIGTERYCKVVIVGSVYLLNDDNSLELKFVKISSSVLSSNRVAYCCYIISSDSDSFCGDQTGHFD